MKKQKNFILKWEKVKNAGVCANALLFKSQKKIMMMKCDHTSNYDNGGLEGAKEWVEKEMKRLPRINLQN